MESAGIFRRSISGSCAYNPLADHEPSHQDTWVCTAPHGAKFFRTDELSGEPVKEVPFGTHIEATRDGNCLHEKSTDLYAPMYDEEGNRNFKNQRMLALEKMNRECQDHSASRQQSRDSEREHQVQTTAAEAYAVDTPLRQSFRWVDADGQVQHLEGSADAVQGIERRPEIWICVADSDVPYRSGPGQDFQIIRDCKLGEKVNAVKEDDWLKVLNVTTSWDAAATLGHRSLHNITRVTVEDANLWLPISECGKKLFKGYQLFLFEESAKMDGSSNAVTSAHQENSGTGCVTM